MGRRTRVKICGITQERDAVAAVNAGADAIGLVFYSQSSRVVSLEQARVIIQKVPPFVTVVGLFVDAQREEIEQILAQLPIGLLQFHGSESGTECERYQRPYIKALRMKSDIDVTKQMLSYPGAAGFFLDPYRKGVPGGTGETFDWHRLPKEREKPIVLAGGLKPGNIAEAIRVARPYGVDVSGGVESAPGIKDEAKIQAFFENAALADGVKQ